ncbi:MAG: gliding motility-associated C-terminal domain-containing protein [Prevotellaceae bacterium]|nr:gliding motility-associated C-terminal domain-containing protein [Prevotellaceae bacterium]
MWCIFVCGLFIPEAGATDYQRIIGGSSTQQLRITVFAGGRYFVERWSGSVWTPQFYPLPKTPLFSLRIGATIYESQNLSKEDVSYTGTGALREMTKRFSGTHQGKPFSVLFSIHYNTSNPDYFTQSATVDVSSIAASTPVKLAYGFDSYVNGCDAAAAITIPDLGYNGVANTPATVRYLTPAQVQSLRMVGAMNTFGAGSLIGFFAMGRPFNYAVSAYYTNAYDNTSPEIRMMNTTTNPFLFGLYAFTELTCPGGSPWDNGIGVAYEIPAGETTTIWTGLSFTTDMDGELDYTWNGSKNHTANVGDSVNLELRYESYNSQTISGIGFHVAIPGLAIEDVCTQTGFTSGVFTGVIGSQFYNVSGAAINAYDSAVMRIPVDILQCGQWIIDANSISAMVRTLPLGSPATLTVPSKIGFATTATPITVCRGDSAQYTVRLPGNVTSSGSFTVNLAVTGNTSAFGAVPSSIAFPAGTNSISFPVWALPGAPAGSSLTITLTGSDKSYIGLNDTLQTTVTVHVATPNVITAQHIAVCEGEETAVAAISQDATATLTWYSDAGGTNIVAQADSFNITATADTVFYVRSTSLNSCPNAASVTVSVSQPPVLITADTSTCAGTPAVITATTAGTATLLWYSDTQYSLLRSSAASFSVTATADSTYYVKAATGDGCSRYDSVHLSVFPFPTLTTHDVAICGGGTVSVAATTTNGSDVLTWYADAACTAPLPLANSFTYTATTDSTFYIKATAGGICSVYDSARVLVSSFATISVRPDTAICAGASIDIYASTPNVSDALSWYSDPLHSAPVASAAAFNTTPATSTTYYVKAISTDGCTSSGKVEITVFRVPVLTDSDTTVCSGAAIALNASTGNPADTLRWYADAGYTTLLTQAFSLTTTSLSGADTTFYIEASAAPGGCRTKAAINVRIESPPSVIATDGRRICYGEEITLATTHADGNISWNTPQLTLRPTASQTYTVTASRPPCPDAADTLVITVGNQLYIAPDALPPYRRNILYQQQLSTNATPPVFTLADGQLPAGILFATDGAIEGTPFKIEYNDAGYPFRVQITDSFGCTVTKDYKLTGGFFIPEVFSPNNDGLNDHFMKGLRVIIFDRLGRRLFDGTDGWDGTHNGRTVPDDVYFYIIYYLENGTHEVRKTGFITVVQ